MLPFFNTYCALIFLLCRCVLGQYTSSDLTTYSPSIVIPYLARISNSTAPFIYVSVLGHSLGFLVDTSSTGTLISASYLPNLNRNAGVRGWTFSPDDKTLYSGRLVTLDITFAGENGSKAISQALVLVVHEATYCPWYSLQTDNGKCPRNTTSKPITDRNPRILLMGIGFGAPWSTPRPYARQSTQTSLSPASSQYNPLLALKTINTNRLTPQTFRPGYILSHTSLTLGLTPQNTRLIAWMSLQKGNNNSTKNDAWDWKLPTTTLTLNNRSIYKATTLIDTRFPQMYIHSTPSVGLPGISILQNGRFVSRILDRTRLGFAFHSLGGNEAVPVAGYEFVVGDRGFRGLPSFVEPVVGVGARGWEGEQDVFVRTGNGVFEGFGVAFDAGGGRLGFGCEKCV